MSFFNKITNVLITTAFQQQQVLQSRRWASKTTKNWKTALTGCTQYRGNG